MQGFEFLIQIHDKKLDLDFILPYYAHIWSYDVTAGGQILEIFEK